MSTRTERAAALRAEITAILTASLTGGEQIVVTSDARDLDKRNTNGYGIVLVAPGPRFEWPAGPGVTRLTWTVYVLAKPSAAVDIWEGIDQIFDALIAAGFPMESAEPGDYERPEPAVAMTGYVLTVTDDYLNHP